MTSAVLNLEPVAYHRHRLHTQERSWAETNCYVDVWIEMLHAWGFEPIAALPFTVAIDFEGDQWTFFKFPHADLQALFGLEVQELAVWRSLSAHLEEQLSVGRPVLVELDSYFLPDTAGTSYQREHVKSTVAAIEIDVAEQRLGYFHGQGYYQLYGSDFVNALRLAGTEPPALLPPYVEFVKRRPSRAVHGEALAEASCDLLRKYVGLLPEENPFTKFKPRFAADLKWLTTAPLDVFHQYSFATLRQFGACYELTATYLQWLEEQGVGSCARCASAFTALSTGAKTLQFQLARAMARKKELDLAALDEMAAVWQTAMDDLQSWLR